MIKLSNRLASIASLVPIHSNIIDIGCDHALLDIYLYQKGITKKIIAADINENALNNAKTNIAKYGLNDAVETRLGNGLEIINDNDKIDTIIIAGMGAHTAVGILKNNLPKLKTINTIIVQSNTKLAFLRKEITKLNYMIDNEIILEDSKKIYTIIRFIKGKKKYTAKEIYFGPILLKESSPVFRKHTQEELIKLTTLLKLLPRNHFIEKHRIKRKIRLYKEIE